MKSSDDERIDEIRRREICEQGTGPFGVSSSSFVSCSPWHILSRLRRDVFSVR